VSEAQQAGRLHVMLQSQVEEIEPEAVSLSVNGTTERFANDSVIISAGGILPGDFLRTIGVEIDTKYGTA
jgi:NADH dehydrogenase FAD-containing subunit